MATIMICERSSGKKMSCDVQHCLMLKTDTVVAPYDT